MKTSLVPFPAWDDSLFVRVNGAWHSGPADLLITAIMIASASRWALVGLVAAIFIFTRGRARKVAGVSLVAVGLCDVVVDQILKPWIHRPRPLDTALPLRALVELHHSFGFPSAHAANSAAFASALAVYRSKFAPAAAGLSVLLGYSRIYVGAHRPLDILFGWITGTLVGFAVARLARRWVPVLPVTPV